MTYRKLFQNLWSDINNDDVMALSAQMSFYFVLSMFPFLISVAALVNALTFTKLWNSILAWFILYLPSESRHLVFETMAGLTGGQERFLTIGLVGTLWAATGGIMSLMASLNVVYKVKETRGYLHRLAVSVGVLIILTILFLGMFGVIAMGDLADAKLAQFLHSPHSLLWLWHAGRWILSFVLTILAVAIIDNVLPDHQRSWRWTTAGSAFTVVAWVIAGGGFNLYLSHFGSYQRTYGVLGTFVVLMIWVYIMSIVVLVGAEINSIAESRKVSALRRWEQEARV
ncbi:MAG: YihY/virulence factor BrkB family protein [Terriglobia bacterium]